MKSGIPRLKSRAILIGTLNIHMLRWLKAYCDIEGIKEIVVCSLTVPSSDVVGGVNLLYKMVKGCHSRVILYYPSRNAGVISKRLHMALCAIRFALFSRESVVHVFYLTPLSILFFIIFRGIRIVSVFGSDVMIKRDPLREFLKKLVLALSDYIVVSSRAFARNLKKTYKLPENKVIAIHWGSPCSIFRKTDMNFARRVAVEKGLLPRGSSYNFIIFCPRVVVPVQNTHLIIKAFSRFIKETKANALLIIIDHLKFRKYSLLIRKLVEILGVKDRVFIIRRMLSEEEMNILYNASDVIISVPSHDQLSSCVVEAMLVGKPIIGNKLVDDYREYLKDLAFLVQPEATSISNALSKIFFEKENTEKLAREAMIRAKKIFCYEKNIKKITYILNKVIGNC